MNFLKRRQQLFDQMEENAALILFSGIETHVSADEYAPFEANRNFFYLTGLRRERMILLMKKTKRDPKEILFIEEADPTQERWYGRKVTVDEAKEISQIEDVRFLESFDGVFDMMMTREDVKSLYFDCYRHQQEDLPDYNAVKAKEYAALYPGHPIRNLFPCGADADAEGCRRGRTAQNGDRNHRQCTAVCDEAFGAGHGGISGTGGF